MTQSSSLFAKTALATALLAIGFSQSAMAQAFMPGDLIVSRTVYEGVASTVTLGQALPGGGVAVGDGTFANVFKNETPDPSFGVTSPIYIDRVSTSGAVLNSLAIDSNVITTSFASKSELALNVSTDGTSVSFMGYAAPKNTLDVSNSNTAAVNDTTNAVSGVYSRAVANVNLNTGSLQVTNVNAYSGNNGRAAVLANGNYYMVGNAGNSGTVAGSTTSQTTLNLLSANTGVQMIAQGSSGNTTVVGAGPTPQSQATSKKGAVTYNGGQYGFDVASTGAAADKTGKDDNFRGMTVFNGTLYVTKGSGGNGINTVYQVGATGALNNGGTLPTNAAITILPGFSTTLASATGTNNSQTGAGVQTPFGIWFGDANTLFVGIEGDGTRSLTKAATTSGGLQEWKLANGTWSLYQTFQSGLIDQATTNTGLGWSVKQDGLRNITGRTNADGSFTIFGTTSTVSDEALHDLGADPNELVSITIGANSTAANTTFSVLQSAAVGSRLGGVALAPVPEPESYAMLLAGLGLMGLVARRKKATHR
jgi:hypothetical protein